MNDTLEAVVALELDSVDLDLVELRRGGSRSRPALDVRVDRRDGGAVTVEDCARASRAIEQRLDEGDLVGQRYVLEVSSPGVERLLRNAADWRRFAGRNAVIQTAVLGGRAEVVISGVEGDIGEDIAVVRDGRGTEHRLALADVESARLTFNWQ